MFFLFRQDEKNKGNRLQSMIILFKCNRLYRICDVIVKTSGVSRTKLFIRTTRKNLENILLCMTSKIGVTQKSKFFPLRVVHMLEAINTIL